MDAFFSAVVTDNPSLSAVPLAVGVSITTQCCDHGQLCCKAIWSGSAMPMVIAKRRCPDLVIVPIRMDRYKEVSRMIGPYFSRIQM